MKEFLPDPSDFSIEKLCLRWECEREVLYDYVCTQHILRPAIRTLVTDTTIGFDFTGKVIWDYLTSDLIPIQNLYSSKYKPYPLHVYLPRYAFHFLNSFDAHNKITLPEAKVKIDYLGKKSVEGYKVEDDEGEEVCIAGHSGPTFLEDYEPEFSREYANNSFKVSDIVFPISEILRFEKKYMSMKVLNLETLSPSYSTPALEVIQAVINEFWIEGAPQGPQKKEIVKIWINENYGDNVSKSIAEAIDTICRPTEHKYRQGRKKG